MIFFYPSYDLKLIRLIQKLQPFFPPLEPLQSLNLRTALYRCLDQVRKNGTLGQGTVLRKTMLDECKGEKLEEILAIFSNVVLKKILAGSIRGHEPLAFQLAHEDFSYTGERSSLLSLIIAHKASLRHHLESKNNLRERYNEFNDLLNSIDCQLDRQHEKFKEVADKDTQQAYISGKRCQELLERALASSSGNPNGLKAIFTEENSVEKACILSTSFNILWDHVKQGTIEILEDKNKSSLLKKLNSKLQDQDDRLEKWQNFGNRLKEIKASFPTEKPQTIPKKYDGLDLKLTKHQDLQIGTSLKIKYSPKSQSADEYFRLLNDMKLRLDEVGKINILTHKIHEAEVFVKVENERDSPNDTICQLGSQNTSELIANQTNTKDNEYSEDQEAEFESSDHLHGTTKLESKDIATASKSSNNYGNPIDLAQHKSLSKISGKGAESESESESELANQILNSMSTSSPSPRKPKPSLSLAERARISMANTRLKLSGASEEIKDASDPLKLPTRSRVTAVTNIPKPIGELDYRADLCQRTRNSMSGREAAQKQAKIDRRKSQKEAKKKQRESSYLHKVEKAVSLDDSKIEMIEGDPDYESVFKSRPKIKTSPIMSSERDFPDLADKL